MRRCEVEIGADGDDGDLLIVALVMTQATQLNVKNQYITLYKATNRIDIQANVTYILINSTVQGYIQEF